MFSYENGTTGIKNFDINGFLSEETVVIPPCEIAEQFLNVIMPYVKLTYSYGQQNQTLSTLRDTLLPKLMSGEIQIP
jgi:type I restriction enzyme S subunit